MPLIDTEAGPADILTFGPEPVPDPERPPLVMLHACGTGAASLARLGEELAGRSGEAVIALNAPGYGDSRLNDGHRDADDPVAAALALAIALLERLALPACPLLGHSMGGFLALSLARQHPQRVRRLIAIEPMAFGALDRPEDAEALARDRAVAETLLAAIDRDDAEAGLAQFMGFWNQRPWNDLPERGRAMLVAMAPRIGREVRRVSFDPTPAEAYRAVTHEVLLLAGSTSPLPARQVVRRLGGVLPRCTVREIAGAGHMSALTHPEAVAAAIAAART